MSGNEEAKDAASSMKSRKLLVILLVISFVGLAAATYLSVLHWQVHNQPGHVSFCAVSETVNCDTVAMSKFSQVLGVPISTWGILFYCLISVLAVWGFSARKPPWPWSAVGALYAAALGVSTFLFLLSDVVIHSFCIMCLTLYLVNVSSCIVCAIGFAWAGLSVRAGLSSFFIAVVISGGIFGALFSDELATGAVTFSVVMGLAVLALVVSSLKSRGLSVEWSTWLRGLVDDLRFPFSKPKTGWMLSSVALGVLAAVVLLTPRMYPESKSVIAGGVDGLFHGVTKEGHGWIGAERPELVIFEYSDYECPFCRKAHEIVRNVVRRHKNWVRLVHIHMPLDHTCNPMLKKPFHKHSCACARATICAEKQGAFWDMNDRLFIRRGGLDAGGLSMLAEKMGLDAAAFRVCMKSDDTQKHLDSNLQECRRLKLRPATPSFRVGSKMLMGMKPEPWWNKFVLMERNKTRKSGASAKQATEPDSKVRGDNESQKTGAGG